MAGKLLQAAVVGASTLLGKEVLEEINTSAAAAWDLRLLEEGDEVEGQLASAGDEAVVIHALSDDAFTGLDLVLFAGTPATTQRYLRTAVKAGAAVIDLTGTSGEEPGFLTRSPWVDSGPRPDLTTTGISVPQPAALMLAVILDRLQRHLGPVQLAATVLEPASQAGSAAVDELHQQTVSLLSFQSMPKTLFDAQVAFNIQGTLGEEAQVDLAGARARIREDLRRMEIVPGSHGPSLLLLQAPVFHGYVISAHVQLATAASAEQLRSALEGGVVLAAEDTQPSNQNAAEAGDLLVAVQAEPDNPTSFWLLLAADNLRLMARSAVAAALELAALRPASRVQ